MENPYQFLLAGCIYGSFLSGDDFLVISHLLHTEQGSQMN